MRLSPEPSPPPAFGSRSARKGARALIVSSLVGCLSLAACESGNEDPHPGSGDGDSGDGDDDGSGSGAASGDGDLLVVGSGGGDGDGFGMGGGRPVCESTSSQAELAPVFLAFAFDVSGSMGKYDHPYWWHDPVAKWTPVRQATTAFFESSDSAGISASMAFFPTEDDECSAENYETPNVGMTALPSEDFSTAFDGYEAEVGSPLEGGDWRGGTPTLHAFLGTSAYIGTFRAASPEAEVAVVLVTDGLPQGCDDEDDEVSAVSAEVAALYDGGAGIRTYVIGIENPAVPPATLPTIDGWDDFGCGTNDEEPCTPPDTLEALHEVAEAGGTTAAFLIDTGDPTATQAAFRQAIDAIRSQAISCELGIPPNPSGGTFDPNKIDVTYTAAGATTRFNFDPLCEAEGSWHYDNAADPSAIVLCENACTLVQSLPGAQLDVAFLCEDRPDVVK